MHADGLRIALAVVTLCVVSVAPAAAHPTATKSSPVGRYKVIFEGYSVSVATWDDATEFDGKGDEVFLDGRVQYLDKSGKALAPESQFRSQTMGDTNEQNGRVQAGSARGGKGGLIDGDTFPAPLDLSAVPAGTSSTFTPAFTLWEGDLIKDQQAVVITPSIWEWDGGGSVLAGWAGWAQTALPKLASSIGTFLGGGSTADTIKKATQLGLDVLSVFNDPGLVGSKADRPIGTEKVNDKYVFNPKLVVLTYDRAEALIRQQINGVSGMIALEFADDPVLRGNYTVYLRVVRATQQEDATAPKVQILPPKLKHGQATLKWTADDPYVEGAKTEGVESYDLAIRKNGRWRTVVGGTEATSYLVRGKRGKHITYRVRARDGKGNTSTWTQARTVVIP